MKAIKYILFGVAAVVMTSCMDSGYPDVDLNTPPYGNNSISETDAITIQQLKEKYKSFVTTPYTYSKIDEDIKIRGYVTGNDIEGNIYSEIALQDESGAIIIAVAQGGICGYLPEGAEIVVSLKDLYIGNYGKQPEIGIPYTNAAGSTYVSRMPAMLWANHFKILSYSPEAIKPVEFTASDLASWDGYKDGGKLATLKNVSIRNASEATTWSDPKGTKSVSLYFNELPGSNVMVYTSPYCDFAGSKVPQGKFNITGIFKNFNGKCEIIIRKIADVQENK
jgi:hypothetical protein